MMSSSVRPLPPSFSEIITSTMSAFGRCPSVRRCSSRMLRKFRRKKAEADWKRCVKRGLSLSHGLSHGQAGVHH